MVSRRLLFAVFSTDLNLLIKKDIFAVTHFPVTCQRSVNQAPSACSELGGQGPVAGRLGGRGGQGERERDG